MINFAKNYPKSKNTGSQSKYVDVPMKKEMLYEIALKEEKMHHHHVFDMTLETQIAAEKKQHAPREFFDLAKERDANKLTFDQIEEGKYKIT